MLVISMIVVTRRAALRMGRFGRPGWIMFRAPLTTD